MLQYMQLIFAVGFFKLPLRTHTGILSIAWKMTTVHIVNTVQAVSLIISLGVAIYGFCVWLFSEGFHGILQEGLVQAVTAVMTSSTTSIVRSAAAAALGPLAPVGILTSATIFLVLIDLLEGRYKLPPPPALKDSEGKQRLPGKDDLALSETPSQLSVRRKLELFSLWNYELCFLAEPTVVLYGMVPELLAVWSLFRRRSFEYVVGAKPVGAE